MTDRPPKAQRVYDYLADIQDAVSWISRHIGNMTKEQFLADRKTQDAVIKNMVDIGEAANNVMRTEPQLEQKRPELWRHLVANYATRIKLTHGYRKIDPAVVWNTVQIDLPAFSEMVRTILVEKDRSEPLN